MTGPAPEPGTEPVRPSPVWPLWAIGALWPVLSPVGLLVATYTIYPIELMLGKMVLRHDIAASSVVLGLVYLLFSFLVFRSARVFAPPFWYWTLGPVGYLAGVTFELGLGALGGAQALGLTGELAVHTGVGTLACALGAFAGTRRSRARAGARDPAGT